MLQGANRLTTTHWRRWHSIPNYGAVSEISQVAIDVKRRLSSLHTERANIVPELPFWTQGSGHLAYVKNTESHGACSSVLKHCWKSKIVIHSRQRW